MFYSPERHMRLVINSCITYSLDNQTYSVTSQSLPFLCLSFHLVDFSANEIDPFENTPTVSLIRQRHIGWVTLY
jgi:hypothetical protein